MADKLVEKGISSTKNMIIFNMNRIHIIASRCARNENGNSYIWFNYARVLRILALTMNCHDMEICNETPTAADFTMDKARTLEFFVTQLNAEKDKNIVAEPPKLESPIE